MADDDEAPDEVDDPFVLSDDERRNGWTEAALRAYRAERQAAVAARVFRAPARPQAANSRYRVFRCWS